MAEPVDTIKTKPHEPGRPEFTEKQYAIWLEAMEPFLKNGNSLHYCAGLAGIDSHYGVILQKYKLNDWFSKKVDAFRASPGEIINEAVIYLARDAASKLKRHEGITKEELDMLKFAAEKHRTAQPFFVTRTENAVADPTKVGKILDIIEEQTDYGDIGRQAEKQMVETKPPVQNPQQRGEANNVQAEPDTA